MSRKRRSRHNPIPPPWYQPRPVELSEEYQREVDRSTEKLERRYARAQKRAVQAEARLARAKKQANAASRKRQIAQLEAELELRRMELDEIRQLMNRPTTGGGHKVMHRAGREERLEMGVGGYRRHE